MRAGRHALPPLVAIVFLLTGTRAGVAQPNHVRLRDSIVAANQAFTAAFARGDSAGIAALYSEGGQLLQPNGEVISGRRGIQAFWQGAIDSGLKQIRLETVEVEGLGSTAAEVGKYSVLDGTGRVLDSGKYVVLWKKEKGKWRLHRDIWNSDAPASGQQ